MPVVHRLYTHDGQAQFSRTPIRRGTTVEVLCKGEWTGGYEVRARYSSFVMVIDKAEGFFSELFDVPLSHVRLPELPDPIWRDDAGNIERIGSAISRPLRWE